MKIRRFVVVSLSAMVLLGAIMGKAGVCGEWPETYSPGMTEGQSGPDADLLKPYDYYSDSYLSSKSDESESAFLDVVVLRPLGLISCAAGLAASIVALPFSLPSGSQSAVVKTLIADPFAYTFKRPIGKARAE